MQESIDAHQIAFLCEFFVYEVLINLFSSWLHSEDLNQSLEKKIVIFTQLIQERYLKAFLGAKDFKPYFATVALLSFNIREL